MARTLPLLCLVALVVPLLAARAVAGDPPRLVVQSGHAGDVHALAFTPDGRHLLSGGSDGVVKLLDLRSGKEVRAFAGPASVRAIAVSPDGRTFAIGGEDARDDTLRFYRPDATVPFAGARGVEPHMLAYAPDGSRLAVIATAPGDHERGVIEVRATLPDGRATATAAALGGFSGGFRVGHGPWRGRIAWMSDGNTLLAAAHDGGVLLDPTTGAAVRRLDAESNAVAVAASRDGRLAAVGYCTVIGDPKRVTVCEAATGRPLFSSTDHEGLLRALAFTPDGRVLLSGDSTGCVIIWSTDARSLSPASERARPLDGFGRILCKLEARRPRAELGDDPPEVTAIAVSPDGRLAAIARSGAPGEAGIVVLDITNPAHPVPVLRPRDEAAPARSIVWGADGRSIAVEDGSRTDVIDLALGRVQAASRGDTLTSLLRERFDAETTIKALSPDARRMAIGTGEAGVLVVDLASGEKRRITTVTAPLDEDESPERRRAVGIAWCPSGTALILAERPVALPALGAIFTRIDVVEGARRELFRVDSGYSQGVAVMPDGRRALLGYDLEDQETLVRRPRIAVVEVATGARLSEIDAPCGARTIAVSPDGRRALACGERPVAYRGKLDTHGLAVIDLETGRTIAVCDGEGAAIEDARWSPDGRRFATCGGGRVDLWDGATLRRIATIVRVGSEGHVIALPDGHYLATRGGLRAVGFAVGNVGFSFEQFDLRLNRPDLVLEALGCAPPALVESYRRLVEKRLRREGFAAAALAADAVAPEVRVLEEGLPFATAERRLRLRIEAKSAKGALDRLLVDVNGVPAFGREGISLRASPVSATARDVDVELSAGTNVIEVAAVSASGVASLRRRVQVRCEALARPEVYVLAVGVSAYVNEDLRLRYAAKDAGDIARAFEALAATATPTATPLFAKAHVLRVLDADASREKILAARAFLEKSGVDDTVVVFFAGHGLLDAKLDYTFATPDIDGANPSERGLALEEIDGLLDGLRARRKLLLMDTCHSGEVDKEDAAALAAGPVVLAAGAVSGRGLKAGFATTRTSDGALPTRTALEQLKDLFADLNRGSGAQTISSASGIEYAYESAEWKNGVFTFAVVEALRDPAADVDRDGALTVAELRARVAVRVRVLTRDAQGPTSRNESLEFDFRLR